MSVEVRALGKNALSVRALRNDGVEKEDTFVEGKDFEFHSGRIRLKQEARIAGFRAGEFLVGPYYGTMELGLDEKGHGKFKEQVSFAGLIFLVIPIAGDVSGEVRFVRIGKVRNP